LNRETVCQNSGRTSRGVESAAEEGQWDDQQQRYNLELFEVLGPDADDEAEEAECDGGKDQEEQHQEGMLDREVHEQVGGDQDDQTQYQGLGGGGADVADHHFQVGHRGGEDFVDVAGEPGKKMPKEALVTLWVRSMSMIRPGTMKAP